MSRRHPGRFGHTGDGQVMQVSDEIAAIGQQGVARQPPFDSEVVEIPTERTVQGERDLDLRHRGRPDAWRRHPGHGASPGRSGTPCGTADPEHSCGSKESGHRGCVDDGPVEDRSNGHR